jgi:3-isopropylmalate/(R)-2-methylmalate dehydratase large subunit
MVLGIDARVPDPDKEKDASKRGAIERALTYMALAAGQGDERHRHRQGLHRQCTNSRIEDMREAAAVVKRLGRKVAKPGVRQALVVPGSGLVKEQAERRRPGQDLQGRRLRVARARLQHVPGHERRPPGARRALRLHQQPQLRRPPGCNGGRTHLVSPAMAAAAAVHGHFVDIRQFA